MDSVEIAAILTLGGGLVGAYTKLQSDMARIKERVHRIEKREDEVSRMLTRVGEAIIRVEKALVKAGLIDIDS